MRRVYYPDRVGYRLLLPGAVLALLLLAACSGSIDDTGTLQPLLNPTDSPAPTPTPAPSYSAPVPPLTVDDVFPPRDLSQYHLDPSRVRTVIATGDVIPARYTDFTIRNMNDDWHYPVAATEDIVSDADISVINLEAPLVDGCPVTLDGFTFCGRPGFIETLQDAGVDVATLENNHIGNYGQEGIDETEQYLDGGGIKWADRSTPAIIDVRGLKFGFLAFNAVEADVDRDAMVAEIQAVRPTVDVLAVSFHWGEEYVALPQVAPGIADDNPVELAHMAIDAGADLIIGNHPHWVQSTEIYKGKWITYAHGNYIFDQMWSYQTRVGVIGKYTFYDDTLIGVEFTPTLIDNYTQPIPMAGQERQRAGHHEAGHDRPGGQALGPGLLIPDNTLSGKRWMLAGKEEAMPTNRKLTALTCPATASRSRRRACCRSLTSREHFAGNRNYFIATTAPDERPHVMPIWGVWHSSRFYFSTSATSRKAKNLANNPWCAITVEDGAEPVILEGMASRLTAATEFKAAALAYKKKYDWPLTLEMGNVYEVRPARAFAFIEAAEQFGSSATRWIFS